MPDDEQTPGPTEADALEQAEPKQMHVDYPEYLLDGAPNIPVIWLDSHAISDIAAALERDPPRPEDQVLRELYERLVRRRREGRILIFESDQLWEIEVLPSLAERCARLLSALSLRVSTSYLHVERQQLAIGMRACLAKLSGAEIPWLSAFPDDPFSDRSIDGLILRVDLQPAEAEIERRIGSYRDIAHRWEDLRRQAVKRGQRQADRLPRQIEAELRGQAETIFHFSELYLTSIRSGQALSDEEMHGVRIHVLEPLVLWKSLGGGDLVEMVDFLHSAYYDNLPIVDIESQLRAWRITGNEKIKSGDVMDIHHISAFLPYCTHMVLDRSMINAVRKLQLHQRYSTVVLPLSEVSEVLAEFERGNDDCRADQPSGDGQG